LYFVKEPAVDIIIINWNYGRFVGDAIQSVKDQSYQKYRCIVIDNGSNDDSVDRIVEAIGGHPQFELFRLSGNLGHLGAALWALEHCAGEFVTFLDADDVLFPAYLKCHIQAHLAAVSPVGFTNSNCVDISANGELLTGGTWHFSQNWKRHGEPALRPIERTMRLTGIDSASYSALAAAARYLPAHTPTWLWSPGSSNMLRRVLLDRIRPSDASPAVFGGVDGFYLPILHALTGSIMIDQQLSAYRVHGANDHTAMPALYGIASDNGKVREQSFTAYARMLCWLIDHVDEVVLMTGPGRYWQVFMIVTTTGRSDEARRAFSRPEFQACLARRYQRFVQLFGEYQVFHELRKRLLFPEFLNVVRAAYGGAVPIAEVSRGLLREIARKSSLLLNKLGSVKVQLHPLTQPTTRTGSNRPLAVVIGPPWLRTGTGRVVEDQIAYYRDRGFATAFVGVPVNEAHVSKNQMWTEFADAARDLGADHVAFAILDSPQNARTLRRRVRQWLAPRTALDWIVEVGYCSRPSPALVDYLSRHDIALFHVNHVFTLGFMHRLRQELGQIGQGVPLLVETHDIQSDILRDRDERNPWTGRADKLNSLLRAEVSYLSVADVLIHLSVDDARFFSEKLPRKPQFLVRPLIADAFVKAVTAAPKIEPIDILLVGTGHHANNEAVEWFLTRVWPLLANKHFTFRIVGGVGDFMQQRRPGLHHQFRNCFVGRVADLAPYYRASRCVVAPMRSGGGISIKTIEAFAIGMPFIGTTRAYRGLPPEALTGHGIRSHDDPRAFADAILQALSDGDDIGKRGRAFYEELFSKDACYAARDEAVRTAREVHLRPGKSRNSAVR
jgi:glycosyltransferase involved in cell wall biosynthesis